MIVSKLADDGVYLASESSFYKVLKENKLLVHRGRTKPKTKQKPKGMTATEVNQVYSWDITYLKTSVRGRFYYLYMFMDVFSRKIVGYKVHVRESMDLSSELIKKICEREKIKRNELVLHSDNGGSMKGATMPATLDWLGVSSSFSRPSVSNDNAYSESLFKTLKYVPDYPEFFKSIGDARDWVDSFVNWYNEEHRHSGIKFVTPSERHLGKDKEILEKRKEVYEAARRLKPERWSGRGIRNWERENVVYLNCLPSEKVVVMKNVV